MGGTARADHRPRVGVTHHDLARLRGRIDAGDQVHGSSHQKKAGLTTFPASTSATAVFIDSRSNGPVHSPIMACPALQIHLENRAQSGCPVDLVQGWEES